MLPGYPEKLFGENNLSKGMNSENGVKIVWGRKEELKVNQAFSISECPS